MFWASVQDPLQPKKKKFKDNIENHKSKIFIEIDYFQQNFLNSAKYFNKIWLQKSVSKFNPKKFSES